jgi:hypothetical protein
MTYTTGQWYEAQLGEDPTTHPVVIAAVDHNTSTITIEPMKATSSLVALPFQGNRAERRRRMFRRT